MQPGKLRLTPSVCCCILPPVVSPGVVSPLAFPGPCGVYLFALLVYLFAHQAKVLMHHGVSKEEALSKLKVMEAAMCAHFLANEAHAGTGLLLLPGVRALLEALQACGASVSTCLVTGRWRKSVRPQPASQHPPTARLPPASCCCTCCVQRAVRESPFSKVPSVLCFAASRNTTHIQQATWSP